MKLELTTLLFVVALVWGASPAAAQLRVDFNSTTQDNGPHLQAGFQPYDAGHEVAADFVPTVFPADFGFGVYQVTVTPDWPNTTDNRVRQMIDRGAGYDSNWVGNEIDLLTDWIGCDSRTGNGGHGDWDRVSGIPTYFTLTLSGLPAAGYEWLSCHHDTENVWADFQVEVSVDGGASWGPVIDMEMTSSSPGGSPANTNTQAGGSNPDPHDLSSTLQVSFVADGVSDVVLRFAPFIDAADGSGVHKQLFGMNSFELSADLGQGFCIGAPNSVGTGAVLWASGSSSVASNDLVLHSQAVPDTPGLFVYGTGQGQLPFGQGFACVTGQLHFIGSAFFSTQSAAVLAVDYGTLPATGQITAGSTWHFQHWYRDPAGGSPAFNASSGLSLVFVP